MHVAGACDGSGRLSPCAAGGIIVGAAGISNISLPSACLSIVLRWCSSTATHR